MYFVVKGHICPCMLKKYFDLYQQKLYGLQDSVVQESKKLIYKDIVPMLNKKDHFVIQMECAQKNIQKVIDQITLFVESVSDDKGKSVLELVDVYIIGGKEKEFTIPKIEKKSNFPQQQCICPPPPQEKEGEKKPKYIEKKYVGDKLDMLMFTMYFRSYIKCCTPEQFCMDYSANGRELTVCSLVKFRDPAQKLMLKFQKQIEKLEKEKAKAQEYYKWQGLEIGFDY